MTFLTKFLEKTAQLISFMDISQIFEVFPSGLHCQHKADGVLVDVINYLLLVADSGLRSAFDIVDHNVFISCLKRSWFHNLD